MKIALLTDLFYPYLLGGGERQFFEISKRLAKNGHDVHVFTLRLPNEDRFEIVDGVKIHRSGLVHPKDGRSFYQLLSIPFEFPKIKGFDIVHANQGISSLFGNFSRSSKFISTYHDFYIDKWSKYYKFPFSLFGRTLEFFWSKSRYDKLITVSNATKRKMEFFGMKNISVIPNGIELKKYKRSKKEKTVLYIGRLVKYKHVDELIKVMSKIQKRYDYKLKIIGMGEEYENLRELSKKLNVDVKFYGFASERTKLDELSKAEIFVNPSTVEGFGIVLLEAMASGCKVVAKPLDAYEFCNGENSILANNLEVGIESAIKSRGIEREAINTAKNYSWDKIVNELEKIYSSLYE